MNSVLRYIRRMIAPAPVEATDGQLLERFVRAGEEGAFDALLERHGRMVMGICRRLLGNAHDAEDAFQATFLVLVRKAGSISRRDSVGSWLFGVAYRTALRARSNACKRQVHERNAGNLALARTVVDDTAHLQLRPLIDSELERLPEKYRAPLVLCYLEGKTNEEAARLLGWTKGTVSGRLARARDLLRGRLARRGITLCAPLFATALFQATASAGVPLAVLQNTVQAAGLMALGKTAGLGAISTSVAALTEGMIKAMFFAKLKIAGLFLFALTLVGTGTMLGTRQALAHGPGEATQVISGQQQVPGTPDDPLNSSPKQAAPGDGPIRAGQQITPGNQFDNQNIKQPMPVDGWVEVRTLRGPKYAVRSIAFSPDGKRLVTGSGGEFRNPGEIILWDAETGKILFTHASPSSVPSVAFSPDGGIVATANQDGTIRLLHVPTGKLFQFEIRQNGVDAVTFSPDGKILVGAGSDVTLWDAITGKEIRSVKGDEKSIRSVAFNRDGSRLAATETPGTIRIWDPRTGEELTILKGHQKLVRSVAFSPDGKVLASGGNDQTVRLWDVTAGKTRQIFMVQTGPVQSVAFSPDGKTLASSGGKFGEVIILDVATGKELARLRGKNSERILSVVFSPQGKFLATVSSDGTVKLWTAVTSRTVKAEFIVSDRLEQLLEGLLKSQKSDKQIAEALYLATLARFPTEGEMKTVAGHLAKQENRRQAFANILFALTHSSEFSANIESLNQRKLRRPTR
jgi:RNA polymerase sigma factor (sigma-70 family)